MKDQSQRVGSSCVDTVQQLHGARLLECMQDRFSTCCMHKGSINRPHHLSGAAFCRA